MHSSHPLHRSSFIKIRPLAIRGSSIIGLGNSGYFGNELFRSLGADLDRIQAIVKHKAIILIWEFNPMRCKAPETPKAPNCQCATLWELGTLTQYHYAKYSY